MLDNKRPSQYPEGFTPRPTKQPTIGFDRPQAQQFPSVGMTLSSYRHHALPGVVPATRGKTASEEMPKIGRGRRLLRGLTWKRAFLTCAIIIALIGGWLGIHALYNLSKIFHGNVLGILSTTTLRGEDTGRVNILLAGNSADDPGHQGGTLTDSIMIVSIDTKDNTAFMLSVPRDLWVDIPGNGHAKINEAYPDGQAEHFNQSGYFNGGMGLLQKVIEQNFDIPIDYYALINYNAFRDAVNAVGGIAVNIHSSDPRGLYDPSIDWTTHGPLVRLSNGVHQLNGEQALDLARARGDAYGSYGFPQADFNRTQNQRMMLLALKDKALSTGVLANPIKLTSLMNALGNNIQTDFQTNEVHRLYQIGGKIGNSSIQSVSLNSFHGQNLLRSYTSDTGESALIPAAGLDDFSDIQMAVKKLMSNDPVMKENASVVVLNATDTYGLAGRAATVLTNKGLEVKAVADASTNQTTTTVIDNSNGTKPATKQYLENLYGTHVTTTNPYASKYSADFIVVLGADRVANTINTTSQ